MLNMIQITLLENEDRDIKLYKVFPLSTSETIHYESYLLQHQHLFWDDILI